MRLQSIGLKTAEAAHCEVTTVVHPNTRTTRDVVTMPHDELSKKKSKRELEMTRGVVVVGGGRMMNYPDLIISASS